LRHDLVDLGRGIRRLAEVAAAAHLRVSIIALTAIPGRPILEKILTMLPAEI